MAKSVSPSVSAPTPRTTQLSDVFPVVVAVTADIAAPAAIRVTHALAQECGAIPTLLRVTPRDVATGFGTAGAMAGVPERDLSPVHRDAHLLALETQVRTVLGILPTWRYEVEAGATVPTIVRRVHEIRAELVILGLPQHNFFRRAFVRDTVQGVVENTPAAVLAIRPELSHRPASILVAVDFGASSLRAAHLACQLVSPGGRIILVYVQRDEPDAGAAERLAGLTSGGAAGIDMALASLINQVASQKGITVTSVIEHGNSIDGVKEVALRVQPDVVALGAKHHSTVDWFFGDSVSTALVSERQWSLLVVPE